MLVDGFSQTTAPTEVSAESKGWAAPFTTKLDPGSAWNAAGPPAAKRRNHRCHHPIRRGDRLYVSYWYGGGVILDISDMTKPKLVAHLDWSPPFGWPTHSLVPIDVPIAGHRWMLVADEHVQPLDPKLSPQCRQWFGW
jgi:hypothetical protein